MNALVWSKPHPKQHGNSSIEHTPMKALTTTVYIHAHTPTHTHIPTFSTPILNYEKKSIKCYKTFEGGQVAFKMPIIRIDVTFANAKMNSTCQNYNML